MSRFEIKMPKLGESITEGTIVSWSVQVGDVIREDDVLFEVNTAKVSAEIPSPVAGRIVWRYYLRKVIPLRWARWWLWWIWAEMMSLPSISAGTKESVKAPVADNTGAGTSSVPVQELPKAQAAGSENERWYSPVVLQLAREARILQEELDRIPGTGYQGRLSKKDIKQYIISEAEWCGGRCCREAGCGGSASIFTCNGYLCCRGYRGEGDGSCPSDDCRPHGDVQTHFAACHYPGGSGYDEIGEVARKKQGGFL